MDIQLPVKDGIEATRDIREMERANNIGTFITTPNHDASSPISSESSGISPYSHPTSPLLSMPVIIVALTASSLQIDRVTALAAGCNDFLTKPVSLPWLQQKLLEWGSMAYLSGFSRRGLSTSPEPTLGPQLVLKPAPAPPAFAAGLDLKADAISAHLHIDTKAFHHPAPPPAVASPAKDGNPALTFSSPTPVLTPQPSSVGVAPEPPRPTLSPLVPPVTDLNAVDSRLEDIVNHTRRPGISPIVADPSLESVVAEGARLVELGRTRGYTSAADSFGQVRLQSISLPYHSLTRSPLHRSCTDLVPSAQWVRP
jgi:CheY-like chemotaxis protein